MTDRVHKSLLALAVAVTFGAALAFLLAVASVPREQEFESDGWASETLKPNLAIANPPYPGPDYEARAAERKAYTANLPDPFKTPGAVFKEATLSKIQQPLYSKSVRNVPESEKRKVFERYEIDYSKHAGFEVDHEIPLSWGGSNDISNLWPQSYTGQWNAHVKDALEVHGLKLIREGKLDLRESQKEIAADWIAMYLKYLGNEPKQVQSRDDEQ